MMEPILLRVVKSPVRAVRRVVTRVVDSRDRRRHPARRAEAADRLRTLSPSSVLFLCLGNVCRSPYAERYMLEHAGASLHVGSAGTIGPGRPPADMALEVATDRGIDHADHRSRTATAEMFRDSGAIFVFDRHNAKTAHEHEGADPSRIFWLGDFDPSWTGKRAIGDPWGKPRAEFDAVFERIERCVDELLTLLPASPAE